MTSRARGGRVLALGVCGMAALAHSSADAQTIGYTVSVNGVRGTYPGERLGGVYAFNGVDIAGGPFRIAAAVPWMRIETTPTGTIDGVTDAAVPFTTTGIGDPLLRFDVRVLDDSVRALQVGLAASVKVPVVDAGSGRGTGEADYAVGTNVSKTMHRTSLLADVLFWRYGDPEGLEYPDAWSYSAAVAQILGDGRWSAIGSVAGFSSGIGGTAAPVALNAGLMRLIGRAQSLGVMASMGLNNGASDLSVGVSWRIARQ